jgi:amino acid adenylation domain-containing protein
MLNHYFHVNLKTCFSVMSDLKAMHSSCPGPANGDQSIGAPETFKCFIVGDGTMPLQCARILLDRGHEICGIISKDAPFLRWAKEQRIPRISPKENIASFLRQQPFHYLFSIVNQRILPKEVFALPLKCAINYHDAPLPKYAGSHATTWAILNRETVHGITWHVIAERVDAGDILKQRSVEIAPDETAFTLNLKCYEAAISSFAELIDELAEDRAGARKQNLGERTFYPRYKRPAAGAVISWTNAAEDISALVRALDFNQYPNPLGLAKFPVGQEFILLREMAVTETSSKSPPGTIIAMDAHGITVSTSTHDVVLRTLQTIDGKSLSIPEFISRFGLGVGHRFPDLEATIAERLAVWNELVAKEESFWVKRLGTLDPVSLPYFNSGRNQVSGPTHYVSVTVPIPETICSLPFNRNDSARRDLIIAAFTAYVACLTGSESFDLKFRDTALRSEISGWERVFSSSVPFRFTSGLTRGMADILPGVQDELALLQRRKTFARDIAARYPELRSQPQQDNCQRWPVAVECVAAPADCDERPDSLFTMFIVGGGQECRWVYDRQMLSEQDAKRMLEQFATFLRGIAENPDRPIASLPLVSENERHQLLVEWNHTSRPYDEAGSIQSAFEEVAARVPDAPALTCRNETWTFHQLDERAEHIAQHLRKAGAGPETMVGICLERSLDLVTGMLGILKAGAAYLPLDPAYPAQRLAFMIEDAQPLLVLADANTCQHLAGTKARILALDQLPEIEFFNKPIHRRETIGGGTHLAYVIFTSGSTGRPKGVMVEHRNVMNFFAGMDAVIGRQPGVWLAVASVSFDISVLEIWWSLTRGFQVVLWPGVEDVKDMAIPELIRLHGVTHMQCVPSFLRSIMKLPGAIEALASLRVQVVGGEAVPATLIRDLGPSPTRRIIDMYGPTETTVVSTAWEVEPGAGSIKIGRPIANTQIYLLTPHGQLAPVGVAAELCIGGAGVTRGYLNRPELNREQFIPAKIVGANGGRLYRTGDLARYLPDGGLEFVGRVDGQMKIRGHRVELNEIESVLGNHPALQAAVIDVQSCENGENRLVAYVVPGADRMPSATELREWLGQKLPQYMVPAAFVALNVLPRNENGKLNRHALPPPETIHEGTKSPNRAPTPLESELIEIWRETLGGESVGLEDDFFVLGGNSLLAVNLMLAIEKRRGLKLPLETLLETPTVTRLAMKLEELVAASPAITTANASSPSPAGAKPRTPTERRLHAIWERLVKARPIGIRDSFLELQEEPTLLDQMLIEIRREFGVQAEGFPVNAFLEEPTIEALARNIDQNTKPAASLVICLQAHGANPPLFVVHDGGSNVFVYQGLAAQLGGDRPVYGIRARLDEDGFPVYAGNTVEEVASCYLDEIKSVRPRGPTRWAARVRAG